VQGYNGDNILATAAQLNHPVGITFDHFGNLYFTDAFNNRVRKIDTSGIITTVAGNGVGGYNGDNIPAVSAELYDPWGVFVDAAENVYISDASNHRIRKVNAITGVITTISGTGIIGNTGNNGLADTAKINSPYGIVLDNIGNIYFADDFENVVRKIDASGIITSFAGGGSALGDNGPADSANLNGPGGLAIDVNGNIYIDDINNMRVRKVIASTGIITTVAGDGTEGFNGDGGSATDAELNEPAGVAIDESGTIYIADFSNDRIRHVGWPEGVHQLSAATQALIAYPNPSSGYLTIMVTSSVNEQVQITFTNVIGQKVKETTAFTNTPLSVQFDQPPGIYYLSAITSHGKSSEEIILLS